jgi:hypothetical protein
MTTQNPLAGPSPATSTATSASLPQVPAPPSWAWRRGALILAGAAQLIIISALNSADPLAVTWASLLLAIAPAPLAAAAAFAPAPVNRLAAVAGVLILVAGIAGAVLHTGLFFVPALVMLAVGGVKLWREQSRPRREVLPVTRHLTRDRMAVLAALAAPLAVAAVLLPFRASWSNTNVALLLVVIVVGVAAIGNRVAGGLAAVWAAIWFDFFFTLPYYRFTIRSSADATTAVLLLLTGLAVSQLAARSRRLKVITVTDAGYLAQIHQAASLANSATAPDAVVGHVKEQLADLLGLEGARFEHGSLLGHPPRLEPDGTVTVGRSRWDVELSGLPGEEIELRTFGSGQYYGRFMLKARPGSKPSLQARLVAVTLADQAGRAFGAAATARSVR